MSLSDFESDLTELSSDEEEYIPASQKRKKPPPKSKEDYKVSNALRPPRTTQYTAKSLYDQIVDGAIKLDPEYQRDVVWPDTKQTGLIDSILRNYYIPPVIFAVTAQDDGTELRTCIDGKQRLTSIQRFMDGLICHKDSVTNKRYWYQEGTAKRILLPKQYKQAFANKQITCVEYDCLTDDQEREIFQRVQLGVALTPAERMQANTGPRSSLIREVQSTVLGAEGFGDNLDWGRARGRDFQCLASIIYLMEHHPLTTFPGAPQLDKWLQITTPVTSEFRSEVVDTFRIFVALVRDKRYNASFSKPTRVSPIEFTMIGILISVHRAKLSMTQLSSAIRIMRADVRKRHVDIRANTKVTKDMFAFITSRMKTAELKSDGQGDSPAAATVDAPPKPAKKVQKRKRVESSSESEEEEVKRKPPPPKPSTSRITASGPAEAAKLRQAAQAKPAAKSSSTIKATTSKAAATAKAPAKQSPSTKKSKVVASSAQGSSTPQSVSTRRINGNTPTPSKLSGEPGSPALPPPSSASGSTSSTPVPPPAAPKPLALPRRSPNTAAAKKRANAASLIIKTEPGLESVRTPTSTNFSPASIAPSPIDRLASIRAAKASTNANTNASATLIQSPVVAKGSGTQIPMEVDPPDNNILDRAAPIVKREYTQPSLNVGSAQHPANFHQQPSPDATTTLPSGSQISSADIEAILAMHGVRGRSASAGPLRPPSMPPAVPQANSQSSTPTLTVPPNTGDSQQSISGTAPASAMPSMILPNGHSTQQTNGSVQMHPHIRQEPTRRVSPTVEQKWRPIPGHPVHQDPSPVAQTAGTGGTGTNRVMPNASMTQPVPIAPPVPSAAATHPNGAPNSFGRPIPTGPRDRTPSFPNTPVPYPPPQPPHPPPPVPSLPLLPISPSLPPPPPPALGAPLKDHSTLAQPMASPADLRRSSSGSVGGRDRPTRWDERDDERDRDRDQDRYRDQERDWHRDRDYDRGSGWRGRGGSGDRGRRGWGWHRGSGYQNRDWSQGRR